MLPQSKLLDLSSTREVTKNDLIFFNNLCDITNTACPPLRETMLCLEFNTVLNMFGGLFTNDSELNLIIFIFILLSH